MSIYDVCQCSNIVGKHPLRRSLWFRFRKTVALKGHLRQLRQLILPRRLGEKSKHSVGEWVQVLNREEISKTLDSRSKCRGLFFTPYEWDFCGEVFQVSQVVQSIIDDNVLFRPISRTVLLEGVDCGGVSKQNGCGRRCPLMFRDEWLKPVPAPQKISNVESQTQNETYFRIRSLEEIRKTLDWRGRRDGLMFMPEMNQWAGMRFPVAFPLSSVFEYNQNVSPRGKIYVLKGPRCTGDILEPRGSCHRGCNILWHEDWLVRDN